VLQTFVEDHVLSNQGFQPYPELGCQKTAVFSQNHYPGNGPIF